MKRALLFSAAIIFVLFTATPAPAAGDPGEVALTVNGEQIFTWELKLLMPQIQSEMAAQGLNPQGQEVLKRTLSRSIDSRLMAQEARRQGIVPDETRIDEKMKTVAEGAGGPAALEAELIKTSITYDQLRSSVVQADLVITVGELVASRLHIDQDAVRARS